MKKDLQPMDSRKSRDGNLGNQSKSRNGSSVSEHRLNYKTLQGFDTPGPGSYYIEKTFGKDSVKHKFKNEKRSLSAC